MTIMSLIRGLPTVIDLLPKHCASSFGTMHLRAVACKGKTWRQGAKSLPLFDKRDQKRGPSKTGRMMNVIVPCPRSLNLVEVSKVKLDFMTKKPPVILDYLRITVLFTEMRESLWKLRASPLHITVRATYPFVRDWMVFQFKLLGLGRETWLRQNWDVFSTSLRYEIDS